MKLKIFFALSIVLIGILPVVNATPGPEDLWQRDYIASIERLSASSASNVWGVLALNGGIGTNVMRRIGTDQWSAVDTSVLGASTINSIYVLNATVTYMLSQMNGGPFIYKSTSAAPFVVLTANLGILCLPDITPQNLIAFADNDIYVSGQNHVCHWNGSAWSIVASSVLTGCTNTYAYMFPFTTTDIWAFFKCKNTGTMNGVEVYHYTGSWAQTAAFNMYRAGTDFGEPHLWGSSSTNMFFAFDSDGIWRSTNTGVTWTQVRTSADAIYGASSSYIWAVDNTTILFSTTGASGSYTSQVIPVEPAANRYDTLYLPATGEVYVGTRRTGGEGELYKFEDNAGIGAPPTIVDPAINDATFRIDASQAQCKGDPVEISGFMDATVATHTWTVYIEMDPGDIPILALPQAYFNVDAGTSLAIFHQTLLLPPGDYVAVGIMVVTATGTQQFISIKPFNVPVGECGNTLVDTQTINGFTLLQVNQTNTYVNRTLNNLIDYRAQFNATNATINEGEEDVDAVEQNLQSFRTQFNATNTVINHIDNNLIGARQVANLTLSQLRSEWATLNNTYMLVNHNDANMIAFRAQFNASMVTLLADLGDLDIHFHQTDGYINMTKARVQSAWAAVNLSANNLINYRAQFNATNATINEGEEDVDAVEQNLQSYRAQFNATNMSLAAVYDALGDLDHHFHLTDSYINLTRQDIQDIAITVNATVNETELATIIGGIFNTTLSTQTGEVATAIDNFTVVIFIFGLLVALIIWAEWSKELLIYILAILADAAFVVGLWSELDGFRTVLVALEILLVLRAMARYEEKKIQDLSNDDD